jgi:hypothetical protein
MRELTADRERPLSAGSFKTFKDRSGPFFGCRRSDLDSPKSAIDRRSRERMSDVYFALSV